MQAGEELLCRYVFAELPVPEQRVPVQFDEGAHLLFQRRRDWPDCRCIERDRCFDSSRTLGMWRVDCNFDPRSVPAFGNGDVPHRVFDARIVGIQDRHGVEMLLFLQSIDDGRQLTGLDTVYVELPKQVDIGHESARAGHACYRVERRNFDRRTFDGCGCLQSRWHDAVYSKHALPPASLTDRRH